MATFDWLICRFNIRTILKLNMENKDEKWEEDFNRFNKTDARIIILYASRFVHYSNLSSCCGW